MIRFAWRQFRFQALVVSGLLVAVAVVFLITGPHMADLYGQLKGCRANNDCNYLTTAIATANSKLDNFATALSLVFPALLGIFWGAPLVARELESGTYRLAWSQGVTRSKWIICKLAVVGAASMIAAGLMSWMLTWWASPIDTVNANRFGYTDLRHSLHRAGRLRGLRLRRGGITAGVLWRRTLPAMATTLVVYVAARLTFNQKLRDHLMTPLHVTSNLSRAGGYGFQMSPQGLQFMASNGSEPNALVFNIGVLGKHGATVTSQWLATHCPKLLANAPGLSGDSSVGIKGNATAAPSAFNECVHKIAANFHTVLTLQPASRFWPFQWIEGSMYLTVGVALCAFSYWWLRRRVA